MGVAAGIMDLEDQISTFFGNSVGRYLTDQVIYPDTALPGWHTTERPIYDQFSAIYKGWAEFDATLINGVRMVGRNNADYRAAVFLEPEGNMLGAALSFYLSPPGGVQNYVRGRYVHADTHWPFSVVLFHRDPLPDGLVVSALGGFLKSLPLPVIKQEAHTMSPDGKIRIKVFGRKM